MQRSASLALVAIGLFLASCATQPDYERPSLAIASSWSDADPSNPRTTDAPAKLIIPGWWSQLKDPAIDALAAAAISDNPTLAQALAAMDGARAAVRFNAAQGAPQAALSGSATRAKISDPLAVTTPSTLDENWESFGPILSWQTDLWGRLRQSTLAAQDRLDARSADAEEARISLIAQIADGVLNLRACNYSLMIRARDLESRQTELNLIAERRLVGNASPVDEAGAASALANARTLWVSQQERCSRDVHALVALSGRDAAEVRSLTANPVINGTSSPGGRGASDLDVAWMSVIPAPPPLHLAVPAKVLLNHPAVISADREAAARWSEIAVARADRLPRIDLAALLTGNWIAAFGSGAAFVTWSVGGAFSAPLIDGGQGAARVAGRQALYREAVADLRATVLSAAQDVEDAIAAQESAAQRLESARENVEADRTVLHAKEAEWRAGTISLFELEDSRRAYNNALENCVSAARDRAQAWVNLVRASGNSPDRPVNAQQSPNILARKQPA